MHIVKVTYTVKAEYAQKNQENIGSVMNDLRKINHAGIRYGTYLGEDGKTFMHFASFEQKEFQQILFDLEAFKTFTANCLNTIASFLVFRPGIDHIAFFHAA